LAGNHIASQFVRSSTSPALHYGEAQGAESSNDFIHKMKVCLKELRETFNCLRLIKKKFWYDDIKLSALIIENNELISIFVASLKTAQKNRK
ncbi:MAG: four helix bundle protein, partial [Chitinophagaceae bacterium]